MSFRVPALVGKILLFAGFGAALAACSSSTNPSQPPVAGSTPVPTTYSFQSIIQGAPPAGKAFSFDIGFVDENAHQYYLADKATNGVDVVNTQLDTYLGTAGAGTFQAAGTTVAGFSRSPNGGPNGVVSIGNGLVAAGDGNSTLKIVSATSIGPTDVASIAVPNPYTGPNLPPNICQGTVGATTGVPTVGAGNFRVDEMAYDPVDNLIIAVSDNACPVFVTLFNGSAPYAIVHQWALTTANGGGEQSLYDPAQGKFFTAIPSTTTNPNGAVDMFDPKTFATAEHGLSANCVPNGFALGKNEQAMLGCSAGSMLLISMTTFATVNQFNGPAPDEVWYSPASNRYYGADSGGGTLAVLDANGNLVSSTPTSSGAHSVAVEGSDDHVYVPQNAGAHQGLTVYDH
jgi:hypothetical protein